MDIGSNRPTQTGTRVSGTKAFLVAGLGTALEYYDFLIYGLAAGLVFNQVFFPSQDPLVGTMYAFAAFGTGFFARPLGGIVIGHFGDRIGRRKMLILTLVTMGVATLGVGLLPTYEQVGLLAPALLVLLRLVQGFAAGGEWGGAALFGMENAPANRRGLWGSFTSAGIGLGTLLGTGVFALVSIGFDGDLTGYAWRIPFLLGGALVVIGLLARLTMPDEEPVSTDPDALPKVPLVEAVRRRPRAVLLGLGVSYGYNTIAYIGFTFFLSYLTGIGYGATESLGGQLAYSAVLFASAPVFALLSDRIGRRRTMAIGGLAMGAFLFAYFPLVGTLDVTLAVLAFAVTGLLTGITQGPIPTFLGEQFPAHVRYSGMSVSYQVGAALGGGTASFVATGLLIVTDHNPVSVAVYGAVAMAVLVVCSLGLEETAFRSTEQINRG
ncbi:MULTISPECIES: MFS transporter [unclassified Pseudonocardia]|uniref:MFS transporter n=1 Tax=unclassified Pseudonocardia TaxID=2619320 RepID=UPI0001FFE9DD|nr:MFS transporter [Pseudonocardia sp. Ae707_Ps1]OLM09011.1 L-Proline/Glycine betaine transporter ProP [Pseudonocardia sp. Ae707_Ps1]